MKDLLYCAICISRLGHPSTRVRYRAGEGDWIDGGTALSGWDLFHSLVDIRLGILMSGERFVFEVNGVETAFRFDAVTMVEGTAVCWNHVPEDWNHVPEESVL